MRGAVANFFIIPSRFLIPPFRFLASPSRFKILPSRLFILPFRLIFIPRPLLKQILAFVFLLSTPGFVAAQTLIELNKGGNIRAKTVDDYALENKMKERQEADSLAYADCIRRGFNALHADSLAEGERLFEEALKLRPAAPGNYILRQNLGAVALARGDARRAHRILSKVVEEQPGHTAARLLRAKAALQLGMAREAVADADVALADKQLAATDAVEVRFVRAAARYEQHLYADALADLGQIQRAEPHRTGAFLLEALCLQQLGKPRLALEKLDAFVAAHPADVEALVARASLCEKQQLDTRAEADYSAAVALRPADASLRRSRAEVYLRLGKKREARRDLHEAVRLGMPQGQVQEALNRCR